MLFHLTLLACFSVAFGLPLAFVLCIFRIALGEDCWFSHENDHLGMHGTRNYSTWQAWQKKLLHYHKRLYMTALRNYFNFILIFAKRGFSRMKLT